MGEGSGGPPPENFENFNENWCPLVESGASVIQKETPFKK